MKVIAASIIIMLNTIIQPVCIAQKQSLVHDSIRFSETLIKKNNLKKAVKMPLFLITGGMLSYIDSDIIGRQEIAEERNENIPYFHTGADDYLQYTPIVFAYGLDLFGVEARHDLKTRTKLLIKSELLMMLAVVPMKQLTHQLR
ncbi:MAG: hypothetical protein RLO12_08700, partial [Fulvivirga sp.]